ncbi:MAG: molybdopterin-dependent oxidoreductase [Candidatus Hydrothermarchaeales archaeon]
MLNMKRRAFMKLAAATTAAAALGPRLVGAKIEPKFPQGHSGSAPDPVAENVKIVRTVCLGCHGGCGLQCKVVNGELVKIDGNPYQPNCYDYTAKGDIVVPGDLDAGPGGKDVGSVCPKGAAGIYTLYNPRRLKHPVRRVGKRGSRKWKRITWETAVDDIVDGGNLFGDGHVDGIKALMSDDPIDAKDSDYMDEAPSGGYGPKRNLFTQMIGRDENKAMSGRFIKDIGSKNKHGHTSICETSNKVAHEFMQGGCCPSIDWENCTYALLAGANVYDATFAAQNQARLVSKWFLRRPGTKLVYVGPRQNKAAGLAGEWVPIKAATDSGFALGITRYIIENNLYKADYISRPNKDAATAAGYKTWTDLTYLVSETEPKTYKMTGEDHTVSAGGTQVAAATVTGTADLEASIPGYQTVFTMLKNRVMEHTLDWYDDFCGIERGTIARIASEYANAARPAIFQYRGPCQHAHGVYNAMALWTIDVLLDRWYRKGGHTMGGGGYHGHAHEAVKPKKASGVMIDRKKAEYKGKKAKPTRPWFKFATHGAQQEYYGGQAIGYPYKTKVLWYGGRANPIYTMPRPQPVAETHKKIPLIVMMDPFMNETSMRSDYVLPDATYFQAFGSMHGHNEVLTKNDGIRVPVVGSFDEHHNYRPIDPDTREIDDIFIMLAKKLGLPNFGKGGLGEHDLDNGWEFWNDYYSNEDYKGGLSGDNLTLAGKFANPANKYKGDYVAKVPSKLIHCYISDWAAKKNSLSDKYYEGLPSARKQYDGAGNDIPDQADKYPFVIGTCKAMQHTQGRTGQNLWLMSLEPENPMMLNPADGKTLGVQTGSWVKVVGQSEDYELKVKVTLTERVRPGYVEIPHGWGHKELGATDIEIDGHEGGGIKGDARIAAGWQMNWLTGHDPAQSGDIATIACVTDPVGGSSVTYAHRVRIERI